MAPAATARQSETRTTSSELLKPRQTADEIGCHPQTLYHMRVRGDGPRFIKTPGGRIYYRRSDVEAWLDQHTQTQL